MPDESVTPSELERLVAEAEGAAQAPVTDNKKKPCVHIDTKSINQVVFDAAAWPRKCPTCLEWFCELCSSTLDPKYCRLCLSEADAALVEEPLKDEEGVVHTGRVMHPDPNAKFFQPRFGTLCKTLSEMTSGELTSFVDYYKDLVKQAEKALDFRRIVLGAAQLESTERDARERRRLRTLKTPTPKTLTVSKTNGKPVKAPAMDLLKMLEALKQIDVNRAAKAAAQAKPKEGN